MNILIIGRGWVGQKMHNELFMRGHEVVIDSHQSMITSKYDYVVNCAGYTGHPNVDACEKNKKETIEANSYFPVFLYERCKNLNVNLAHFSSGCIYEGTIDSVNADPNYFGSIYSVSKGISDSYLKDKCLVFRIRMPFTKDHESKNLFNKLVNYSKRGKLYEGGENSLTDLDEAVEKACDLIENKETGPFNLVNKGSITNHEIADMLNLKAEWHTPESFRKATVALRSNCTIPQNANMRDVREALKERIKDYLEVSQL